MNIKYKINAICVTLLSAVFVGGCSEDTDVPPPESSDVSVSVYGDFYAFQTDPNDFTTFSVVQPIPPNGAEGVSRKSSVILFMDDLVDPSTITDSSLMVTENGQQIFGQFAGSMSTSGNAIVSFTPYNEFSANADISVAIDPNKLLDDGGNPISISPIINFKTTSKATAVANEANFGFENGLTAEFLCSGDCGTLQSFGPATPVGSQAAFISTGIGHASSGYAIGGTTSTLTLENILNTGSVLKFKYNFISEEFDTFVGSEFDDTFILNVTGPNGAISQNINTVNQIGVDASLPGDFPALAAEHTGTQDFNLDISSLGSPVNVQFVVSDVGDSALSTVVMIDEIGFDGTTAGSRSGGFNVIKISNSPVTAINFWTSTNAPQFNSGSNYPLRIKVNGEIISGSKTAIRTNPSLPPTECKPNAIRFSELNAAVTPGTHTFTGKIGAQSLPSGGGTITGEVIGDQTIERMEVNWEGTLTVQDGDCLIVELTD